MFSGNNNMLYGGPLGAYLSGIYQPTPSSNLSVPSSSSMFPRRGSLRGYNSSLPQSTSPCNSSSSTVTVGSPFYTPQPRRKFGNIDNDSYHPNNSPSSYSSSRYLEPSSTSSRNNYISSNLSRSPSRHSYSPYSGSNSSLHSNSQEGVDYKRLYENEKRANGRIQDQIDDTKKSVAENKVVIESLKRGMNTNAEKRRNERRLSEYQEELKLHDKLTSEQEKLKAENRALKRVVARLSSTK